jgi:hypothetical protein
LSVVEEDDEDDTLGWCFIRSARLRASAEIEAAVVAAGIGVVVGGRVRAEESCRACVQ